MNHDMHIFVYLLEPTHEILVLIENAKTPYSHAHAHVSSVAGRQNFGLGLSLLPYFVHIDNGYSENTRKCKLVCAITVRQCDKNQNIMSASFPCFVALILHHYDILSAYSRSSSYCPTLLT